MELKKEITRRDKKIEELKKEINTKNEEIAAMNELLDCAAANLVLAVKGKTLKLSKKEVSEALGKYHLRAKGDNDGNYILEIEEE